jgi:hydrogenase maturation protease
MSCLRPDVLIIGYGNPLRGDDDAGPEAARRLAARGCNAIDLHQLTPEVAEPLAAAKEAFFLDADSTLPGGEIRVSPVLEAAAGPLEHHATPAALLRLAREVYGSAPRAWLVGMGGETFDVSEHLTPAAIYSVSRCEQYIEQALGLQEAIACTKRD